MGIIIRKTLPSAFTILIFLSDASKSIATESSAPVIEEVLVTAQMRVENVQMIPIAIGVYDKKFKERAH
jgi:hypothetical protein